MDFLVFSNLSRNLSRGFLAPAMMDSAIVVWTVLNFLSKSTPEEQPA